MNQIEPSNTEIFEQLSRQQDTHKKIVEAWWGEHGKLSNLMSPELRGVKWGDIPKPQQESLVELFGVLSLDGYYQGEMDALTPSPEGYHG